MIDDSLFSFDQVRRSRQLGGRHFDWVEWDLLKRNAHLYGDREAFLDTFHGTARATIRRRSWQQAYDEVNILIFNLLARGLRRGAAVVSQLPATIESTYLDLATSKIGAMHAGLNVDVGEKETLGVIDTVRPDVAVIVPEWHGRDFAAWYDKARRRVPNLRVFALLQPGEAAPPGTEPLAALFDEAILETYQAADLDYLRPDPLDVHELLPTSGTTGVPKLSKRTTMDWFHVHSVCIAERAGHSVYDGRIHIGPLNGGSGRLWGVHTVLYSGGRTLYLTEFDEADVYRLTEQEELTIWTWNPALITRLVTNPLFAEKQLPTLRLVSYSGAPLPSEVIERLSARGVTAFNVYGTSEVGGCMSPILPGISDAHLKAAAGVPFEGFDVPVVDARGERLAAGEVGEILIWNIHHGYFADVEASRATYEDDAYGGSWRGYQKTGDLGVYDEQGYLTVVGRKKDMILRGGQNIFPKEIENLLGQHASVSDIAIVAMPDAVLGERACAFVVPRAGEAVALEDLTAFLDKQGVAKFKWPERVEVIDEMPLSPGGKTHKVALRERIAEKIAGENAAGG